ncbi:MAG TPA: hypothetical protein VN420_00940 [Candidatus Fimivivens sp.]|nr:hypothetical protein [Candidatus Fimivivens sp.]
MGEKGTFRFELPQSSLDPNEISARESRGGESVGVVSERHETSSAVSPARTYLDGLHVLADCIPPDGNPGESADPKDSGTPKLSRLRQLFEGPQASRQSNILKGLLLSMVLSMPAALKSKDAEADVRLSVNIGNFSLGYGRIPNPGFRRYDGERMYVLQGRLDRQMYGLSRKFDTELSLILGQYRASRAKGVDGTECARRLIEDVSDVSSSCLQEFDAICRRNRDVPLTSGAERFYFRLESINRDPERLVRSILGKNDVSRNDPAPNISDDAEMREQHIDESEKKSSADGKSQTGSRIDNEKSKEPVRPVSLENLERELKGR